MIRTLSLTIALTLFSFLPQQVLMALPEDLSQEVYTLSQTLSDGHAKFYPEQSQFMEVSGVPALGDQAGIAVLMSMGGWSGGNTNNQYVALFAANEKLRSADKKYRLVSFLNVGGKGDRLFTQLSHSNQTLVLSGFDYGKKDALCCPTQPITVVLAIGERSSLEETTNPPQ